ncbi:MAG TPA: METTL5 family protein, partial [Thermoplasmata archaeon]
ARRLSSLEGFSAPDAALEQVVTPAEAAVGLLQRAYEIGDIEGRSLVDLGSGTGVLSLGAALLGAGPVVGVESDEGAVAVARRNAAALGADVTFVLGDVSSYHVPADTVVMNPPFGAQRRHADRPFWDAALDLARVRVYAFALASSRTFIARRAVARRVRVESTEPVPWELPRTFPHHRKPRVEIPVDLWVLAPAGTNDAPRSRN